MNFFVYILFFFLINFSANALSIKCHFEEVHQNGDVNQGIFFLKNEELRYEYFDEKLFTILYANKKLFAVENTEFRKAQLLENQDPIIISLLNIYKDFPGIKNLYQINNGKLIIEKNNDNFIKRIGILTNKLNFSIYFYDCLEIDLNEGLFDFNPFIEYVPN